MAQQQECCGAAFDLDGLTLRWYTHRGAAHQVGPSLREPEYITDDRAGRDHLKRSPFGLTAGLRDLDSDHLRDRRRHWYANLSGQHTFAFRATNLQLINIARHRLALVRL